MTGLCVASRFKKKIYLNKWSNTTAISFIGFIWQLQPLLLDTFYSNTSLLSIIKERKKKTGFRQFHYVDTSFSAHIVEVLSSKS